MLKAVERPVRFSVPTWYHNQARVGETRRNISIGALIVEPIWVINADSFSAFESLAGVALLKVYARMY